MSHTPEPWEFWHGYVATDIDSDGAVIICDRPNPSGGKFQKQVDENFKRIVACVNACSGISQQYLEELGAQTIKDKQLDLIKQRDALLLAIRSIAFNTEEGEFANDIANRAIDELGSHI